VRLHAEAPVACQAHPAVHSPERPTSGCLSPTITSGSAGHWETHDMGTFSAGPRLGMQRDNVGAPSVSFSSSRTRRRSMRRWRSTQLPCRALCSCRHCEGSWLGSEGQGGTKRNGDGYVTGWRTPGSSEASALAFSRAEDRHTGLRREALVAPGGAVAPAHGGVGRGAIRLSKAATARLLLRRA